MSAARARPRPEAPSPSVRAGPPPQTGPRTPPGWPASDAPASATLRPASLSCARRTPPPAPCKQFSCARRFGRRLRPCVSHAAPRGWCAGLAGLLVFVRPNAAVARMGPVGQRRRQKRSKPGHGGASCSIERTRSSLRQRAPARTFNRLNPPGAMDPPRITIVPSRVQVWDTSQRHLKPPPPHCSVACEE